MEALLVVVVVPALLVVLVVEVVAVLDIDLPNPQEVMAHNHHKVEIQELMDMVMVVVVEMAVVPEKELVAAAVLAAAAVAVVTTVAVVEEVGEIFQILLVVLEILFLVGIVVNMQEEEMVAVDLNLRGTGRPATRLRYKVMEEELVNQALFS
jgi:hypothetical protein